MGSTTKHAPGPLGGLRVVDLTTSYAGPTASMYLADLGAEVIKVERPVGGDDARAWGPPFIGGDSAWFASANRNKRSLALDVASPEGLSVLDRLLRSADVFLENLNPSKLERLGLDQASVTERHPHLIYCALSGFGLDGPDHDLAGYDLAAQARSGLMSVTGEAGGRPQRVSTALSDIVTGTNAALAVCAAVIRQRETGEGDVIDVSLIDSDLALMAPRIAAYLAGGPEPAPSGGTDSVLAVYQTFAAADRDIVVAIGNDSMWLRFCIAIGLDELGADARFADNTGRREHRGSITAAIADRISERPADAWLALLEDHGVPSSLVRSLSEVTADEHAAYRESFLPVPGRDGLVSVRSPFRLRSIEHVRNERFPELGEHSLEIVAEAGLGSAEIDGLLARGIIASSSTTGGGKE